MIKSEFGISCMTRSRNKASVPVKGPMPARMISSIAQTQMLTQRRTDCVCQEYQNNEHQNDAEDLG